MTFGLESMVHGGMPMLPVKMSRNSRETSAAKFADAIACQKTLLLLWLSGDVAQSAGHFSRTDRAQTLLKSKQRCRTNVY